MLPLEKNQMNQIEKEVYENSVHQAVKKWLSWDRQPKTKEEIKILMERKDYDTLAKILLNRIGFGTAGLRAPMGAGFSKMNDLVVIQTAQGILKYLLYTYPEETIKKGIVVGFDGRHNSSRFAELTTAVFLGASVPVYFMDKPCPTPFVSFGVLLNKCVAGIMVTASHNPKEDNGYKVYGRNGAQITSPIDKKISLCIKEELVPLESSWNVQAIKKHPLKKEGLRTIYEPYICRLIELQHKEMPYFSFPSRRIVYTPMHGVGWPFINAIFAYLFCSDIMIPVKAQVEIDPDFRTLQFPNPEEDGALNLSIATAEENECSIVFANDPDADRLAIAEKVNGKWKIFNGNEIGALLGWWTFTRYLNHPDSDGDLSRVHMISSTVSSKILKSMAKKHGFVFHETLTGFKWMGNLTASLVEKRDTVLLAFEEAIGFMVGSAVPDKDGIAAAATIYELILHLDIQEKTLTKKLSEIYETYGQHISSNSYFKCDDPKVIKRIFNKLRNFTSSNDQSYPSSIMEGKYKIESVRDLTTGFDSSTPDKKAILPWSSDNEMITFTFENGLVATLRTSGTEPKIKYYTELCSESNDLDMLNNTLEEMVGCIVEEFLEPNKNELQPANKQN